MAKDSVINNAYMIEKEIEAVVDKALADSVPKVILLDLSRLDAVKKIAAVRAVQLAVRSGVPEQELNAIVRSYE